MTTLVATLCLLALSFLDPAASSPAVPAPSPTPSPPSPSLATANPKVPRVCTGCNFGGSQLAGSDFSNGFYSGANFANADLRRASFRGARLVAANFANADLRGATFEAAECTACNFDSANLDGAIFANARMAVANFGGFASSLDRFQLRQLLTGCFTCNFHGAHLAGRDLSGLAIVTVDFSQADLRGAKFDGSILCWHNAAGRQRAPKCDTMTGAQVQAASFRNVQVCDDPLAQLSCVAVDAATLRRLTGSPLSGAILP